MSPAPMTTDPRILLVSVRGLHPDVSRCLTYEFEDAITVMDHVHLFAPGAIDRSASLLNKVLKTVGPWTGTELRRCPQPVRHLAIPPADYQLTLVVVQTAPDLRELIRVRGWQEIAPRSICLVEELWVEDITSRDLDLLERFDQVILNCRHAVQPLSERIKTPVTYLPPSVDMSRFCPADADQPRPIDVFSMGRRPQHNHQLLLERSRNTDFFYLYDTARFASVLDPSEHRELLANTIQRTKWFPVNRAKVDEPGLTSHQPEVGFRYFEGAAAGAVMIGERPDAPAFAECFGWEDSVVTPDPDESILDVIDRLEADPQRTSRIRHRNVAESLLRHDSSDRFAKILDLAGLTPTSLLTQRLDTLKSRSAPHTAGGIP